MSTKPSNAKKSYMQIRNQCGLLAVLLPWLALFSSGIAAHPGPDWWWSISATYYLSPALVAVMTPACLILFNYIGYDWLDNLVTDLSALFGLGLVLFPCKVSWIPDGTKVGFFQLPVEYSHIIHVISSAIFFLLLAINFIFLFTKSKEGVVPTPKKLIRNTIYRVCGWGILATESLFVLTSTGLLPKYLHMPIEILLLSFFGFGWLVKGEFFKSLNDAPEKQPEA